MLVITVVFEPAWNNIWSAWNLSPGVPLAGAFAEASARAGDDASAGRLQAINQRRADEAERAGWKQLSIDF